MTRDQLDWDYVLTFEEAEGLDGGLFLLYEFAPAYEIHNSLYGKFTNHLEFCMRERDRIAQDPARRAWLVVKNSGTPRERWGLLVDNVAGVY